MCTLATGIQLVVVRAGRFDDSPLLQGQRVLVGTRMPGRPIRAPIVAQ